MFDVSLSKVALPSLTLVIGKKDLPAAGPHCGRYLGRTVGACAADPRTQHAHSAHDAHTRARMDARTHAHVLRPHARATRRRGGGGGGGGGAAARAACSAAAAGERSRTKHAAAAAARVADERPIARARRTHPRHRRPSALLLPPSAAFVQRTARVLHLAEQRPGRRAEAGAPQL